MRKRMCNQYGCDGEMRPTREVVNGYHRLYRCVICGKKNPWSEKPKLDGSMGELHKVEGGFSALSIMSDPVFYPPKLERKRRPV